jgi:hypothetical protein
MKPPYTGATSGNTPAGFLGDYGACVGTIGNDNGAGSNAPANGAFRVGVNRRGARLVEFKDGTSVTLMVGERHIPSATKFGQRSWDCSIYDGYTLQCSCRSAGTAYPLAVSVQDTSADKFGSWHAGVVPFVFADAHVQTLSTSIAPATLTLLANIHDGQVVPAFD